jgi:glycosyltransferase involved in cell wall biosynthesis
LTQSVLPAADSFSCAPASLPGEGGLDLTILMPCLNEARTLPPCVHKALTFLARSGLSGEVLVADNGSSDGSQDVALSLGARVVDVRDKGYGNALIAGIKAARGRWVVMGDSDDSYDFGNLDGFVEALRGGAQLVMGNRFAGGIAQGAMPPLHRYLGNPVLSFIGRLLFKSPCKDFHCGLRAFDRAAIIDLELSAPGMEFASEMVVKAAIRNLRIAEVPTTLARDGRDRPPHLRSWRDGWRHLRFLFLFSPRWLFLHPGIAMFALGLLAMLALLGGPVSIGRVGFDIGTLLYSAALALIGWQSVLFWVCAKLHGVREGIVPPDPAFERAMRHLSLEAVLLGSVALFLTGLTLATVSLTRWQAAGFGVLESTHSLRLVIAAVTVMLLAVQTAYTGMFLAVLQIRRAPMAGGAAL